MRNLKLYTNLSCENSTLQKTNYFVIWFHCEKGKSKYEYVITEKLVTLSKFKNNSVFAPLSPT
jgi:hypothetical protein